MSDSSAYEAISSCLRHIQTLWHKVLAKIGPLQTNRYRRSEVATAEGDTVQTGVAGRNTENFSRRSVVSQGPSERTETVASNNGTAKAKPQVETARKRKAAKLQVGHHLKKLC